MAPPRRARSATKNELPFTAAVTKEPPSTSASGFGAVDAILMGVVAGALVVAGTGALLLTRREVPRTA